MAEVLGPFPGYAENREHVLRVLRNHRRAALSETTGYEQLHTLPVPLDAANCADRALVTAARAAWDDALAMAERLPQDVARAMRNLRRGRMQLHIDLAHLKRVGDQLDRAANRLSLALVIAALIIGSSIVMNVKGGPTLFGLPAFGFMGFIGAVIGGLWLVRSIWRSNHGRTLDDEG